MNEKKYLDYDGLYTLVSAFKDLFPLKTDIPNDIGFVSGGYSTPLVLTTLKKGFYILSSIGTLYYKASESSTRKNYNDNSNGCPFAMLLTRDFENTDTTYQLGYILTYADDGRITYYDLNWNSTQLWATNGRISNNYGSLLTSKAQTFYGNKTFEQFPVTPSSAPITDYQTANKKYVDDQISASAVQFSTMPTADSTTVGKIVQYVGTTDANYTNGYFYIGTTDGEETPTYSWGKLQVQDGDGNLNLVYTWQGYPNDTLKVIDFTAMEKGVYLLSNLYCNNSSNNITYYKKNGTQADVTVDTGGTSFNYAVRSISITNPVSEIPSGSSFGIIGSADIVDLTDGTVHNRRIKYYTSDGTVAFTKETRIPVMHYITDYAQTITGVKTFASLPQVSSYTAPTSNTQLSPKKYVDDQLSDKLNTSKVKTTQSSTSGDVYDVNYINGLPSTLIAPAYDSTATYSIGDYVIYNNGLYKCSTTISTAEAWTAAHWTQTTIMAELNNTVGNINTTLATLATPSNNGGGA